MSTTQSSLYVATLVLVSLINITVARGQTIGFSAPVNFGVGNSPRSAAVGDFNGDGKQDLAVANFSSSNISILLGTGNGGFAAAPNVATGTGSTAIAVTDFDGDGKQDLAVANGLTNSISILLGNGSGGFGLATNFMVGQSPISLAAGDFNRDGKQDLAVVNNFDATVSVFVQQANGTFSLASGFPKAVGSDARSVVVGDVDRNGTLDLVVAANTAAANDVSVFLGNGDGTFGPEIPVTVNVNAAVVYAALGDFNQDGKLDLAVWSISTIQNFVSVLVGNGNGTFGPATNFPAGGNFGGAIPALGDFNGDGKLDIAVPNQNLSGTVSILPGNGVGFDPPAIFAAGSGPTAIVVGDFNGDGKKDLAVVNQTGGNVSVLSNNTVFAPSGAFGIAANVVAGFANVNDVAVGDFNGDGKLDLAVAIANNAVDSVSVLLGNGTGGFAAPLNLFLPGARPRSLVVGDFNRDGKQDVAVVLQAANSVLVLLGDGSGRFPGGTSVQVGGLPISIAVGDFNRDGKQDLVVTNASNNNISVLLGDGTGGFGPATNFTVGSQPASVAVGDFNQDGKQDLAVANHGGTVSILLGDGNGGFGAATNITVGNFATSVAVGDFNGDGKQDLAVANSSSNTVSILLGTGTGSFGPVTNLALGTGPIAVVVGDFNRDGKQDLAILAVAGLLVLFGDGSGSFGPPTNFTVPSGAVALAAGDFNGDGKQDLALANFSTNKVSILLATPTVVAAQTLPPAQVKINYLQEVPIARTAPTAVRVLNGSPPPGISLIITSSGMQSPAVSPKLPRNTKSISAIGAPTLVASGTPTQFGSFLFNAVVEDQIGSVVGRVKITVCPGSGVPSLICDSALLEAEPNVSYNDFISIQGGTPPFRVTLANGTLPEGLSLNLDGTITGIPTLAAQTSMFTARATDNTGAFFDKILTLTVVTPITIAAKLKNGSLGSNYSMRLKANGGFSPVVWSADLPPGLILDSFSGVVSGTPQEDGKFRVTIEATDAIRGTIKQNVGLSIGP